MGDKVEVEVDGSLVLFSGDESGGRRLPPSNPEDYRNSAPQHLKGEVMRSDAITMDSGNSKPGCIVLPSKVAFGRWRD